MFKFIAEIRHIFIVFIGLGGFVAGKASFGWIYYQRVKVLEEEVSGMEAGCG